MASDKYGYIKNQQELLEAIEKAKAETKVKSEEFKTKYYGLKRHYTPVNMAVGFLRKNSDYYNWAELTLALIGKIRRSIISRKSLPAAAASAIGTAAASAIGNAAVSAISSGAASADGPAASPSAPHRSKRISRENIKEAAVHELKRAGLNLIAQVRTAMSER